MPTLSQMGCHFKVKWRYRSQKPLTPSMIILLKILCDDSVITERIATGTLSDLEDSAYSWVVMTYLNNSYWLSHIAIEGSVLFSFHITQYWSSGNIMCTEVHTVLCWFVLLFVLFLKLLSMEKCFYTSGLINEGKRWKKLIHYWEK